MKTLHTTPVLATAAAITAALVIVTTEMHVPLSSLFEVGAGCLAVGGVLALFAWDSA